MRTSSQVTYKYFIEDMVGEGSHTEFFLDFLTEAVGKSNSSMLYGMMIQEFCNGFKNNKLGELNCVGWGAYGDIHFEFLLNQQQEADLKGFKATLDIWAEHFVTKYRLRQLFKFYTIDGVPLNLRPDHDVHPRDLEKVAKYCARRTMRLIPAWKELLGVDNGL